MEAAPSTAWTGVRELDWAQFQEQCGLPLQAAVLDAGKVTRGTRVLDVGCGTGILSVLGSLRGADVTVIDGSEAMLNVARQRLPACDVRLADLEALPFEASTFDAVLAVNSLFFARNLEAAVREMARVLELGHLTQTWLAVSDDSEATTSGASWYHQRRQRPAADSVNQRFQD